MPILFFLFLVGTCAIRPHARQGETDPGRTHNLHQFVVLAIAIARRVVGIDAGVERLQVSGVAQVVARRRAKV
jgi:hypothetical protein